MKQPIRCSLAVLTVMAILAGVIPASGQTVPANYKPQYFGNGVYYFDMEWYVTVPSTTFLGSDTITYYGQTPDSMCKALAEFRDEHNLTRADQMVTMPFLGYRGTGIGYIIMINY